MKFVLTVLVDLEAMAVELECDQIGCNFRTAISADSIASILQAPIRVIVRQIKDAIKRTEVA